MASHYITQLLTSHGGITIAVPYHPVIVEVPTTSRSCTTTPSNLISSLSSSRRMNTNLSQQQVNNSAGILLRDPMRGVPYQQSPNMLHPNSNMNPRTNILRQAGTAALHSCNAIRRHIGASPLSSKGIASSTNNNGSVSSSSSSSSSSWHSKPNVYKTKRPAIASKHYFRTRNLMTSSSQRCLLPQQHRRRRVVTPTISLSNYKQKKAVKQTMMTTKRGCAASKSRKMTRTGLVVPSSNPAVDGLLALQG